MKERRVVDEYHDEQAEREPKRNHVVEEGHGMWDVRPFADYERPQDVEWRERDLQQAEFLFRHAFLDELQKVKTLRGKADLDCEQHNGDDLNGPETKQARDHFVGIQQVEFFVEILEAVFFLLEYRQHYGRDQKDRPDRVHKHFKTN